MRNKELLDSEFEEKCLQKRIVAIKPTVVMIKRPEEHKANQLLALNGYKVESHICTQIALSRILDRKDLARKISEIFELRQNIGYRMFLKHSEEEKKNAERVFNEDILPFLKEINQLIGK